MWKPGDARPLPGMEKGTGGVGDKDARATKPALPVSVSAQKPAQKRPARVLSSATKSMRFMARKTEEEERARAIRDAQREQDRARWVVQESETASGGGKPRLRVIREQRSLFAGDCASAMAMSGRASYGGFNKSVSERNARVASGKAQTAREEAVEADGINDVEMTSRFAKFVGLDKRGGGGGSGGAGRKRAKTSTGR